ncbi:hypothetical protein BOTBODRAFT_34670 [Botryobasidium botryosum FD-172 SS1]|uniref:Phytocyanin domain-containing protein n=1 Tax=Botryobasidium botryosum (strain FD-172 SS1) TaxID=930990 RepID=A0A067MLD6_BOTB1|nr:hypothetical protein BOTBODRAFT_34670 [Botryobasidium botryosum FD-172 SS1]
MLHLLRVALLALPLAYAQMTHTVVVGGPGVLLFDPQNITAAVGDTVLFSFRQKNHTATQSSFASPCKRLLSPDGLTATGFDSGFQPVPDNQTASFPEASFVVQDTNPIWIYCRQTGHCQSGMVFSVNAAATGNTFDAFKALAVANGTSTTAATPTAAPSVVTVTQTITLGANTWTTTYGSYPGSGNPTPAPQPVVHTVIVGGTGQLVYTPDRVVAQPRDIISFQFKSKNHTATQSTFANPCRKLEQTSTTGQIGFDSGFMPSTDTTSPLPSFNITVNDTAPIWVYCRQAGHCGQGMVFAVNSVESGPNNFSAFQALAKQLNGSSSTGNSTSSSNGAGASGKMMLKNSRAALSVAAAGVLGGIAVLFL